MDNNCLPGLNPDSLSQFNPGVIQIYGTIGFR
jgi:hypothetical protein